MSLIEGKQRLKSMPGLCEILISEESQQILTPQLFRQQIANLQQTTDEFSKVVQVCSLPQAFLRLHQSSVDLLVTYD